jgi:transcriptional regulator of heat shock response
MAIALTARQTQILKAIVDEYISTAEPVGSSSLDKKYNLGVSPATIRAEMAELTKMKYLKQPHTSAGRIPTPHAMKFYINQLMEEKHLGVVDEVKAKEEVWDSRNDFDKLMSEAAHSLAKATHSLAIAVTDDGDVWKAGMQNIFDNPEFTDLVVCQNIFSMIDQIDRLHELFFERLTGLTPVEILFGSEMSWPTLGDIGVVATRFNANGRQGAIGVIGPFRTAPSMIPSVRYFKTLIEELTQ